VLDGRGVVAGVVRDEAEAVVRGRFPLDLIEAFEIGRASCRERV